MAQFNVRPEVFRLNVEKNFGKIILETWSFIFYMHKNGSGIWALKTRGQKSNRQVEEDEKNGFHVKMTASDHTTMVKFPDFIQKELKEAYSEHILLDK